MAKIYKTGRKMRFDWNGKRTWRKVYVTEDGIECVRGGSMMLYEPDSFIALYNSDGEPNFENMEEEA